MYTSTCRPFALFLLLTIAEGTKVEEKVEGATKHSRNSEGLTPGDICGKSNNQIHGCLIVEGQVFCTCTKATACFEDVFDTVLTENAAEHDELLCIWEQWQKQTHGKREKRNDPWVENKQINMPDLFMTPEEDTTYYYDERTIYHDIPESRPPLGQEPDVTMRFTAGMTRRPRPRGPRRTRPGNKQTTTKLRRPSTSFPPSPKRGRRKCRDGSRALSGVPSALPSSLVGEENAFDNVETYRPSLPVSPVFVSRTGSGLVLHKNPGRLLSPLLNASTALPASNQNRERRRTP
ncbi:unnamed protein product [Nippostrongylus brasiliensis]|uniref:EB domain-containing protein n=1 Tax=Nippostrongylus brasiliensis TaxID=27835 RepID=A0A0N4XZY1_NIPBR|nr:unnamed protein product [Nippostrongylus brasiliensis]